jgi:hypothetical protein
MRRLSPLPGLAGLLLGCALTAGPACAAPAALRVDLAPAASRYDAAQALKAAGVARTAFDRPLGDEAAKASLGFLCGLQPYTETHGAAGAFGVNREGRFLGAQLRFGFR